MENEDQPQNVQPENQPPSPSPAPEGGSGDPQERTPAAGRPASRGGRYRRRPPRQAPRRRRPAPAPRSATSPDPDSGESPDPIAEEQSAAPPAPREVHREPRREAPRAPRPRERRPALADVQNELDLIRATLEGVLRDLDKLGKMLDQVETERESEAAELESLRLNIERLRRGSSRPY